MQLFLLPNPRTIYLISGNHALLFKQPDILDKSDTQNEPALEKKSKSVSAVVEVVDTEEIDRSSLIKLSNRSIDGVLGLLNLPVDPMFTSSPTGSETFLVVVSASSSLPPILPNSHLTPSKVLGVEFHCLGSNTWDDPSLTPQLLAAGGTLSGEEEFSYNMYHESSFSNNKNLYGQAASAGTNTPSDAQPINPCDGVKKILSTGTFYFPTNRDWDMSKSLRDWDWERVSKTANQDKRTVLDVDKMNRDFVWNFNILRPLIRFRQSLLPEQRREFDDCKFLVPLIQGFIGSTTLPSLRSTVPTATGSGTSLALISRLGWRRAGARFRTRGVDDDGNVANFVESETVFTTNDMVMTFLQTRGSVPLFWEQVGNQTFGQKVQITRPQQASQSAFDKHFLNLLNDYGSVHCVNLLGQGEPETVLSEAYQSHMTTLIKTLAESGQVTNQMNGRTGDLVNYTPYDFHGKVRLAGHEVIRSDFGQRLAAVQRSRDEFGWNLIDRSEGQVVMRQSGVFRVNCMDCLDRTNYVEDVISLLTVASFLESIGVSPSNAVTGSAIQVAHSNMWADNGDALSKIYAGTGALNTSVTRSGKKSFGGMLLDAGKSVGRALQATFGDGEKQASIELLLGIMAGQSTVWVFDPQSEGIQAKLQSRLPDYSTPKQVSIYSGTWNLCGRTLPSSIAPWLFPNCHPLADIYAISFQELVPLTAQQILQTDPAARARCEELLTEAFGNKTGAGHYVLLRSEQLVGSAVFVYVKADLLPFITRVAGASKKTGLRGMSGNKGGCGIRLDLHDTSICLMTSHLAAGHGNVLERNADYHTINNGLTFSRGQGIEDHDVVVWAADFNYRVELDNMTARAAVKNHNLQDLWEADQLRMSMLCKDAFTGYDEGAVTFDPTYKYDIGTDNYDSSEKQRIPAWTDRVLYKGKALKLKRYTTAPLKTSDHRPVYATFDLTVHVIDKDKKRAILNQLKGNDQTSVADEKPRNGLLKQTNSRRAPPKVPKKAAQGVEQDDASTNPSSSPSASLKSPPPPRPSKPESLQSSHLDPSSSTSSLTSCSPEDDFVRVKSMSSKARPPPPPRPRSLSKADEPALTPGLPARPSETISDKRSPPAPPSRHDSMHSTKPVAPTIPPRLPSTVTSSDSNGAKKSAPIPQNEAPPSLPDRSFTATSSTRPDAIRSTPSFQATQRSSSSVHSTSSPRLQGVSSALSSNLSTLQGKMAKTSLGTQANAFTDKMAKTSLGSRATGMLNASRSSASNSVSAPRVPPSSSSTPGEPRRLPPAL